MKSTFGFTILVVVSLLSLAPTAMARTYLSAKRPTHLNFVEITALLNFPLTARLGGDSKDPQDAYNQRLSLKDFNKNNAKQNVVEWPANKSFETAFQRVRDNRVLKLDPNFSRRPTWLFPDDGCFARAEVMSKELQSFGFPAPSKIFAFGDLRVKSKNSPSGAVTWWYHVVVGYRVKGEVMVIDPAVEANQPMSLKDWINAMGGSAEVSTCQTTAIDPDSKCQNESEISTAEANEMEAPYLVSEWDRIKELGRLPEKELGDEPPWLIPKR